MRTYPMYVVLALAAAGCAKLGREPNFSGMSFRDRPFDFRHNIELFEVSNGMRVALIPDRTTNIATFDLRYDVGAAEDPDGRTGMAHLVEHLAFEYRATPGGPTLADELQQLTLYYNAATSWDYTHFTETTPIENLERVIALEGRRMRAPCAQLEEATFRRELDVVMQEERQRYDPSMKAYLEVMGEVYGAGHPYSRPLSSAEVTGATREEFCAFVDKYYAPDRAYMVVTGNFDPAKMRELIGRTFGPVKRAAGKRTPAAAATLNGRTTRHLAPIDHPMAMVVLPYPSWGGDDIVLWDVVRSQLASALSAADDKHAWIRGTAVFPWSVQRQRVLVALVEVEDEKHVDRAVEEVFARAASLAEPKDARALRRTVSAWSLDYINSWDERGGRGEWISMFMQHAGHNWFMLKELRALHSTRLNRALPLIVKQLVRGNSHVALMFPSGKKDRPFSEAVSATPHQVTPWRAPVDAADADRPVTVVTSAVKRPIHDYTLGNGMRVVLAPDSSSQIVDARVVFPVGSAHEPADRPFLATAAAKQLGLADLEAEYQIDTLVKLSWILDKDTVLAADVDETSTTFVCRGSAMWGDWHVWLLSWWLDQGTYNRRTLRATRRAAEQIAAQEKDDKADAVRRTILERLFGTGHPYATPPAEGEAWLRIEADDLKQWRSQRYRADGAILVVSGGFETAAMKDEIEEQFGEWQDGAPPPLPVVAPTRPASKPSWFAVGAKRALQVGVVIAAPTASDRLADEPARRVLVAMLEDELRDIREGMAATYSVDVDYVGGPAGGALYVSAQIDEARAPEAVERMLAIVDRMAGDGAAQRESFVRARKRVLTNSLARSSGASAVASALESSILRGQDTDHAERVAERIAALTPAELGKVAAADLSPQRRVVVLTGKRPVVDAVYARIGAKPEVLDAGGEEDEPADEPGDEPADEPAGPDEPGGVAGTEDGAGDDEEPPARAPEQEPEDELFIGDEHARAGQKSGAYYLGTRQISLDEFLRLGGAEGVRKRIKRRKTIRRVMLGGSVIGAFGGLALYLTASQCSSAEYTSQSDLDACVDRRNLQRTVGIVMAGTGLVLAVVRNQLGDGVPDDEDLAEIAKEYNGGAISVSPVAVPGGGGLIVSGKF